MREEAIMAEWKWTGKSGRQYNYGELQPGSTLPPTPGNYIFVKIHQDGRREAIYIGETGNLSNRLAYHNEEACARRYGATHIHAHQSSEDRNVRMSEESDLIAAYSPPCNG